MVNDIHGAGSAGSVSNQLAIQRLKEEQQQSYMVTSELQFMIGSLQNLSNQIQSRMDQAKQERKTEAAAGVLPTELPPEQSLAPKPVVASDLADVSKLPPEATAFAESFLLHPNETQAKLDLLLHSTNVDTAVKQLGSLSQAITNVTTSNVNDETRNARLQALLPAAEAPIALLQSSLQHLESAPTPLLSATQTLVGQIGSPPASPGELAALNKVLVEQTQNPTSALNQVQLQHQQVANSVGASLNVVVPAANLQSARPLGGAAPPPRVGAAPPPALKGASPGNPWAAVWQWLLGSAGLMAQVGGKLSELYQLVNAQGSAAKLFSKLLPLIKDLKSWGIPSHFNPSVNPASSKGWASFQADIQNIRDHWSKGSPNIKELFNSLRGVIASLDKFGKVIPPASKARISGFSKVVSGMMSHFMYMYNNLAAMRNLDALPANANNPAPVWQRTVIKTVTPHYTAWVMVNNASFHTWHKVGGSWKQFTHHVGSFFGVNGKNRVKASVFSQKMHQILTSCNANMGQFISEAKGGGPNIESMSTQTQSQVKLYMMYNQQIMQTAPSIVQTLSQLIQAIANNMKGG